MLFKKKVWEFHQVITFSFETRRYYKYECKI
jgi:hypothetical protein